MFRDFQDLRSDIAKMRKETKKEEKKLSLSLKVLRGETKWISVQYAVSH